LSVAVVSERDHEPIREALLDIEQFAGTGRRKCGTNFRSARRLHYLTKAFAQNVGRADVFFGSYPKPLPYFFPWIEVLEYAIKAKATGPTRRESSLTASTGKKMELTNALRLRGVPLGNSAE